MRIGDTSWILLKSGKQPHVKSSRSGRRPGRVIVGAARGRRASEPGRTGAEAALACPARPGRLTLPAVPRAAARLSARRSCRSTTTKAGTRTTRARCSRSGRSTRRPAICFPNNYPPLSFAVVALLTGLFGDPVLSGRVLSLLGILRDLRGGFAPGAARGRFVAARSLCRAALRRAARSRLRRLRRHERPAAPGPRAGAGRRRTRDERPQPRADRRSAVLLMGLGGLVKHSLIALPLAITAWLWLRDRKAFAHWVAGVGSLRSAVALLGLWLVHGGDVFGSILGGARDLATDRPRTCRPIGCAASPRRWRSARSRCERPGATRMRSGSRSTRASASRSA